MNPERWERIQSEFHALADLPAAERETRLAALTTGDPDLAAQVRELLAEDASEGSLLDRDLGDVAQRMLAAGGPEALPRSFGPYQLRGVIGEGGMGTVFLAERADLESLVAIKFQRDAWLSPARRQRFVTEQRTLAQLNHAGIARLYDAGALTDGTPWIAMEYVEGVPITQYCAAGALGIPGVLRVFRETCEAVLHAHQHAVIHRDLKPTNILVTAEGRVKLLDFGIAKRLVGEADPRRTSTGEWPMTPAYAAPEQVRGGTLGVQTDIYSLGVILYELLAGRLPFDLTDRTPGEIEHIVAEQEPEPPSAAGARHRPSVGRGAWADLDVLCLTAMQKSPERRYRSVESLIRDLDHFLRGEPLEARPDTLSYRFGKFARRHWRPLAATGAALLAIVGVTTFYTVRLRSARNQALAEVERTRRIEGFMTGLFAGGDPEAGPSDSLRVVTLIGRGVQEARALGSEPAVQAELYQTLGGLYQNLGQLDRADSLLRDALAVRRTSLGPRHPDVARSFVALGLLRSDQSQLDEAERLVREGLALARAERPADPAGVARATTALGTVLENRGGYDEAIRVLSDAAALDSTAHLPATELSSTLTELANCEFYAGRYAASDSLNRRLIVLDRGLYGDRHPHVASDLINLGALQKELGHPVEAERYYRQALAIYRGWYGEEHYETAASLTMVGRALIPQGRYREATEVLQQALAIREKVYGPNHPNVASTVNELALVAQKEGRLAEAEALFRREVEIYRTAYHDHHYLVALAQCNLGNVLMDAKRYPEAEALLREGLRRYGETLPAGHLYVGIARIKLGRVLLRERRFADAAHESQGGYEIVARQNDPGVNWLQNARHDLVEDFAALGQTDEVRRYQAELDKVAADSVAAGSR